VHTDTTTAIIMNSASLYRLMAWLSPSYPVGAFSYSHGLEWLIETGAIHDAKSLAAWLDGILAIGSGRNDAILFAQAHDATLRGSLEALCVVAEYAGAFTASAERFLEVAAQGKAFAEVTCRTWGSPTLDRLVSLYPFPVTYPVAVAIAAADHGIALISSLDAYVHAFAANLVSAGMRLIPLGHTDGQRVLMQLEPAVTQAVAEGIAGDLTQLSSVAVTADIAAMKHETQHTRLFRS
jgi:urease accessory protein